MSQTSKLAGADLDALMDEIVARWAISAVEYARAQIVPNYGPDEAGTPYERGMIQRLAGTYRDGWLAACEAFRAALLIRRDHPEPRAPFPGEIDAYYQQEHAAATRRDAPQESRRSIPDDNHLAVHPRKTLTEHWAEEDDPDHD